MIVFVLWVYKINMIIIFVPCEKDYVFMILKENLPAKNIDCWTFVRLNLQRVNENYFTYELMTIVFIAAQLAAIM